MGQAKKRRSCPAQNREITSTECGENRVSRYACPEACVFNSFAPVNYDALLEIEDRLDTATMQAVAQDHRDPAKLAAAFQTAVQANAGHGQHAAVVWHLFFDRDTSNRTFGERWAAAGMSNLKNDERVLFHGKIQMRVALLEIHRIFDDRLFEAVDLLDPNPTPLRFVDRSVSATAARFSTILSWIYPLPHFWRLSGTGIGVTDIAPLPCRQVLDECVKHLGGPAELDAKRRWLAENFARIDDALTATGHERRRQMLTSMDGYFGSATYEITSSLAECQAALSADPAVDRDTVDPEDAKNGYTAALVWFDAGPSLALLPGRRVLGRIILSPKVLRVEAIGAARLDDLRRRLERRLGAKIKFSKERRDDVAGQLLATEPAVDLALVPPRLLNNPTRFDLASSRIPAPPPSVSPAEFEAALRAEQLRKLMDEAVPALDGCTPRQAARKPALRADLIEWVKGLVRQHDQRNLMNGRTDDINELIRTLSLSEIDFPPAPKRKAPAVEQPDPMEDDFDDEADDDGDDDPSEPNASGGRATNWSAPPLPNRPLSNQEAVERLQQALDAFDTAGAAIDELISSGSSVLDDTWTLCEPMMDHEQFGIATVLLIQIWFALVPRGASPLLRPKVMAAQLQRQLQAMATGEVSPTRVMQKLLADSPQPQLLQIVAGQMLESAESGKLRMPPEAVFQMVILTKVLIAELDHALRQ